jgi:hypothetical protein
MDFEEAIADLEAASKAAPDIEGLRKIRATLVEPDFFHRLDEIISRSHNRPEARRELESRLLATKHGFREQIASRTEDHGQMTAIVTGSGLAVGVGGVLALLTQSTLFPLFPLLPIAAGIYSVWRGTLASRRLALEIAVLGDIDDVVDRHLDALRKEK